MAGTINGPGRGALDIPDSKIAAIIGLAQVLEAQERVMPGTSFQPDGRGVETESSPLPSTAARKLQSAIERLSDDEQAVLLALAWIGEESFSPASFDAALVDAFQQRARLLAAHIAGLANLADLLERGAAACGAQLPAAAVRPIKPGRQMDG